MNSKSFLILALSFFLIFSISSVSAIVVYGDWDDGSQSISIDEGEGVDFWADFFTMSPSMTINIKIYDSGDKLVHSFENNKVINDNGYYEKYSVTENIYGSAGKFEVVLTGSDSFPSSDSHTLKLTVNDIPDPVDPLEITSTPVTEVDEKEDYEYQVVAEGGVEPYTFSLTESPNWLSIDSNTGLVSGTALNVDEDTEFDVSVRVADDNGDIKTQSYVLTVRDVSDPDNGTPVKEKEERSISNETRLDGENPFVFKPITAYEDDLEVEHLEKKDEKNIFEIIFVWLMMLILLMIIAIVTIILMKKDK